MNFKLVFLSLVVLFVLSGCTQSNEDTIKFGLQATPESSIVQIAAEKGFFEEQGMNVEIVDFTAGKFALQAFLADELDFAVVGDLPVALATMQGNELYVLAEIAVCPGENPMIVLDDGSKDAVEFFSKTKRKITTSIGGTPEFYTYNFLKYYNIDSIDVEIIAQKPEEMVSAFSNNSVDAMSIFEPYPSIAERVLSGKTKRFDIPGEIYSPRYVIVADKKWVDSNPENAKKFVKALLKAEEFIVNNKSESQAIVAESTKFDNELITKIWGFCDMSVGASDGLVKVWTDEANWAIETNKLEKMPIPNFESILRRDIIESARGN